MPRSRATSAIGRMEGSGSWVRSDRCLRLFPSPRPLPNPMHGFKTSNGAGTAKVMDRASPGRSVQVLRQPGMHLPPPDDSVLRLGGPVPLIGEEDEPAGDAPALEGGEHADPLGVGHAEVEGAVDDERGRLEVL